jgi:uroporphyrinogen decarboxylase
MNDFIKTLNGQKTDTPPIWLMRQAGRYLPEYKELRASVPDFMTAVLTPDLATEITLQPIRRYPQIDAAILFSDILVIPYALGQDVQFVKGEGPSLGPLPELIYDASKMDPIIETVSRVRAALPPEKTLIGFAGSPWTVACYMISGRNHDDFLDAKHMAFSNPDALDDILSKVTDATIQYLIAQVNAGANVIQLFESWAGLFAGHKNEFERFIIRPNAKIVAALKEQFPELPIIGFPRACGTFLPWYVKETKVNAVGLDWSVDLNWANNVLPKHFPVQGNLDPSVLMIGGEALMQKANDILDALHDRPFIFNLGHGVIQFTPPEHVAQLLEVVKA